MSFTTTLRRATITGGAAVAAIALGTTSASAHDCIVPMYNLNGPQSVNWLVITAEDGAQFENFVAECDEAVEAGYAALREAGLPVGFKLSMKHTIGENSQNPNGANGKGLELFTDGTPLPGQVVGTWIGAASEYDCGA